MELDKKELTEFAELVRSNADKKIESIVKGYMDYNSVNSEATIETPNVNNNEAQKKDCNTCEYRWMPINDCCRCDSLNDYEYWKQAD